MSDFYYSLDQTDNVPYIVGDHGDELAAMETAVDLVGHSDVRLITESEYHLYEALYQLERRVQKLEGGQT